MLAFGVIWYEGARIVVRIHCSKIEELALQAQSAGILTLCVKIHLSGARGSAAAFDFGGTLILNICENFKDKQIIPDLIDICGKVGINFEEVEARSFEQANLRLKV